MSRHEGPFNGKGKPVLGDAYRHIWLTRKVAEGIGVDLDAAMRDGLITRQDHTQMVTRCRLAGCDCPCTLHVHGADREKVPGYCANKAIFETLKTAQTKDD
ncbi:hypothetical protein TRM7557_01057 [Tritonibacter multivorans]|uniref:DUF6455 domain-containing protein n=1 Tax=Tritonibacter multivorans TaxID=928856 RepID=A0A0P1G537_9RHOB|nr:DUF6455 family protein [Tritonibacter multivorans]MDA7421837.1 DUF6455 family protein [Tritonibacter multivorans]CUH76779.1 hypothetical protein TRM7557_01057 [Tritonibacter multivorans]SFD06985.1 hypothetical protein SAMN04488049_106150 [Tritonibacter multivorans]